MWQNVGIEDFVFVYKVGLEVFRASNLSQFVVQAEDVIRDLVRSRGLGDVYKRQVRGYRLVSVGASAVEDGAGDGSDDLGLSLIHI